MVRGCGAWGDGVLFELEGDDVAGLADLRLCGRRDDVVLGGGERAGDGDAAGPRDGAGRGGAERDLVSVDGGGDGEVLRAGVAAGGVAAAKTNTFLGERYRRLVRRRGKMKALVAVARSSLVIVWHLLANPSARYTDLGSDFYDHHLHKDRKTGASRLGGVAGIDGVGYRLLGGVLCGPAWWRNGRYRGICAVSRSQARQTGLAR